MRAPLKNNKGFLAMDFIFGLVLVVGLLVVVMSFALTLSTVEVAQYIVFASARNVSVAHSDPAAAQTAANQKFDNLASLDEFTYINNRDVFQFQRSFTGPIPEELYNSQHPAEPNMNWGVVADLTPLILDFTLPYFGASTENPGNNNALNTRITSFLGRSPSQVECRMFNQNANRFEQGIRALPGENFSNAPTNTAYYAMEDNGC